MIGKSLCADMAAASGAIPPLLVDERDARRLLGGLCAKSMYNLRQQGLPFVKVGSRVMYAPAQLAAWVERQKGGPQDDPQK